MPRKPKTTDNEELKELPPVKNKNTKVFSEVAKQYGITDREKLFCDLYTNDNELRGNGVRCYGKAFNLNLARPGTYNSARVHACELLKKENVLNYIKATFETLGLNDAAIDGELMFAIRQNADLQAKVQAIKVANELLGRIQKQQQTTAIQFNINIEGSEGATVSGNDKGRD